jgi:SHS2 domain-containing protein
MHEWVDHTSELELHVAAPSAEEVVAEATAALGELLGEPEGGALTRRIEVEARDTAGLLAAWLEEVVFLAEHDALIASAARDVELGPGRLRGNVIARRGRPSHLVKAVTYHRLELEGGEAGWEGRAVLDV